MAITTEYPLGHDLIELERLDTQALLLHDPLLEELAAKSTHCLEIGCGNGSNLPILRQANPLLHYTGIDTAKDAINNAKVRYCSNHQIPDTCQTRKAKTNFHIMDGSCVHLEKTQFDLVFTKLVLWSVGPSWSEVLNQAYDLLAPGGTFYALEPCNQFIEMQPVKPATKVWMNAWDQAAIANGFDPFIGTKVAGAMHKAGFSDITSKFHPVIAMGADAGKYKSIIDNLKGFYMGPAAECFGLSSKSQLKSEAIQELDSIKADDLVMDALFVTWGNKPE